MHACSIWKENVRSVRMLDRIQLCPLLTSLTLQVTCLKFHGNRIVSGSDDSTLKVWHATTGKVSEAQAAAERGGGVDCRIVVVDMITACLNMCDFCVVWCKHRLHPCVLCVVFTFPPSFLPLSCPHAVPTNTGGPHRGSMVL